MSNLARLTRFLAFAALLLWPSTGCPEPAPRRGWDYTVRVAPDLSRLHVRVCFHGFVPERLVLARNEGLAALRVARRRDGSSAYEPNPSRDGIRPRGLKDGGCLEYDVDLRTLARIFRRSKQTVYVGRDLVTRTGLVLLHPATWPAEADVRARVVLPAGLQAALPWAKEGQAYMLRPEAMLPHARLTIGHWKPDRVEVGGARLDLALLEGPHRVSRAGLRRWLTVAGETVSELYGGFPVRRAQVVVQPLVPGRGRPVVFGRAALAGGPHLHVMLSGTTTDDALSGEWITIHEMIHLGMPPTPLAARWFQEGFVTYYETVLRARAGLLAERQAWQRLHDSFRRGMGSGGRLSLADESRLMNNRYAYHRVYMGGAALALLLDVEIRRLWPGQKSLDDAMRYLQANYVRPGQVFTGLELMRRVDAWLGRPLSEPLMRKHLASREFPALEGAYAALGLGLEGGRIVYRRGAPQARDRGGIMRRGGQ